MKFQRNNCSFSWELSTEDGVSDISPRAGGYKQSYMTIKRSSLVYNYSPLRSISVTFLSKLLVYHRNVGYDEVYSFVNKQTKCSAVIRSWELW